MRKLTLHALTGVLVTSAWLIPACSSDSGRAPPPSGTGGATLTGGRSNTGGGGAASGGSTGARASGGAAAAGNPGHTGGKGPASGGSTGDAGSGAHDSAGAGADNGDGGAPPNPARCPSDDNVEPIPDLGSLCDPAMAFSVGQKVLAMGSEADQLISITPDELSVLWFDARGSVGTFRLADRSDRDAPFAGESELLVRDVIALSPDGLRLAGFSVDQSELVEYVRAARGAAFGAGEEGSFATLNADAREQGYRVLDLAIAPDDRTLYYNVTIDEDGGYPLRVSKRSGSGPWPLGTAVEACEFKGFGGLVRHPTAISADGLTLFYYDPIRDSARAAFRRNVGDAFTWFRDLGPKYQATVNESCERLYFSGSGSEDEASALFVAQAK